MAFNSSKMKSIGGARKGEISIYTYDAGPDSLADVSAMGYFDVGGNSRLGIENKDIIHCYVAGELRTGVYNATTRSIEGIEVGVGRAGAVAGGLEGATRMSLSGHANPLDNHSTRDADASIATISPDTPNAALTKEIEPLLQRDLFSCSGSAVEVDRYGSLAFGQVINVNSTTGGNLSNGYSQIAGRWSFMTDAAEIDIQFSANRTFLIVVDGVYVTKTPINTAGTAPANPRCNIDFGSRKPMGRRVDIWVAAGNTSLYSVYLSPSDTLWKPNDSNLKVAMQGDSFSTGTNSNIPGLSWPCIMSDAFGWYNFLPNGAGGTGFIATQDGAQVNYGGRIPDLVAFGAEKLILCTSSNDDAYGAEAIEAAAYQYFIDLFKAIPDIKVVVLGAIGKYTAAAVTTENAVKAAVESYNSNFGASMLFVPAQESVAGGIVFGAGNTANKNGTGNADYYVSNDTIHFYVEGQVFWSNRMIAEMVKRGVTY